jgi:peptidoglycan/LPS O-acetylase OafA/YrhL
MGTAPQTVSSSIKQGSSKVKPRQSQGLPAGSPSVHLDALRGFAAFSVLLNHWRDAFFVDYSSLPHHNLFTAIAYLVTGLGHQWVIVFFVMSGYLVGGSALRSISSGKWSWRGYLLARMTRLYIVLLPALLLGGVIDWAGMHMAGTGVIYSGHSGMHALTENVHLTLTWPMLLGNALFLQTAALPAALGHGISAFGTNGPLWSLCNEFWYYIAFPIGVLIFTKGRTLPMRIVCLLSLIAWGWLVGRDIALLGIPWLMGVLISSLPPFPARRRTLRALAIVSALVLLSAGLILDKKMGSLSGDLLLGVFVTTLIWVILHCAKAPLPNTYVRVALRAARSSYTLYLVHLPMLIFLKAALRLPRALPGWNALLVGLGVMAVLLLYAQVVYQIFERNTDVLRQWLKPHVLGRQAV